MTEILSEAEIESIDKDTVGWHYEGRALCLKAINLIKLQRQQLVEQKRKVWNEAITKAIDTCGDSDFGLIIDKECLETLLKPESEASGD